MTVVHHPVLLKEVLEGLELKPGAVVLDATVGLGGHAEAILHAMGPSGRLIAVDRDREALANAQNRLAFTRRQIHWAHGTFMDLDRILKEAGVEGLDAVLFDLGVSSLQLEEARRGFSFLREGPLDMRMDQEEQMSAEQVVNRAPLPRLKEILREFGEERWAGRIARAIVRCRPLRATTELAEVVTRAVPAGARHGRIHPATRTFQAIRMAVNRETQMLQAGLEQVIPHLKAGGRCAEAPGAASSIGGRIAVLAYHSLEDRIVKTTFRAQAQAGAVEIITRKPIRPSAEEVSRNPRSRSACLRIAKRLP